ncbi:MAG: glycosyltransferase family 39 protein [archaeon]
MRGTRIIDLILVFSLIVYPVWVFPEAPAWIRFLAFNLMLIWIFANRIILVRIFGKTEIGLPRIRMNLALIALLAAAAALHIPAMSHPIYASGDEAYHVNRAISFVTLTDRLADLLPIPAKAAICLAIAALALGWLLLGRIRLKIHPAISHIAAAAILNGYFFLANQFIGSYSAASGQTISIMYEGLVRFPPLSVIPAYLSFLLLPVSEFSARLPSLIFYCLSAAFMFRFAGLYSRDISLQCAAFLLLAPGFFVWAHLGYLTAGTVFFVLAIMYYFSRWAMHGSTRDALLLAIFFYLGFLYKRPILFTVPIMAVVLLLHRRKAWDIAKSAYPLMIPVVPILAINSLFTWRKYTFYISNWTSFGLVTRYFALLQDQLGWILYVCFILGMAYMVAARRRHLLFTVSLAWFVGWYAFFVSDLAYGIGMHFGRLVAPYLPACIFISAVLLLAVLRPYPKWAGYAAYSIIALLLAANSLTLTYRERPLNFPYRDAVAYIADYVPDDAGIYAIKVGGGMPLRFYRYRYKVAGSFTEEYNWTSIESQNAENLYSHVRGGFSYVLLPKIQITENTGWVDWAGDPEEQMRVLAINPDLYSDIEGSDKFVVERKFGHGREVWLVRVNTET